VPHPWLEAIDYATLENMPTELIGDKNEDRRVDVLWRVKVDDEWQYLFFLLEFQSSVDRAMAVRMMVYVGLVYQTLLRSGELPAGRPFPPILPIVLYNGETAWTALTDLAALIGTMPAPFDEFVPRMKHLVIDMSRFDIEQLKAQHNLVACLMRAERLTTGELGALVTDMCTWLPDDPELSRTIASWLVAVVRQRSGGNILLQEVQDIRELGMSRLEESFKQAFREHEEKGIEKGRQEGEAGALQKLLSMRFGPLPDGLVARIDAAPVEQIDIWLGRVLSATRLDDVFLA
jgi:hypothetical protein